MPYDENIGVHKAPLPSEGFSEPPPADLQVAPFQKRTGSASSHVCLRHPASGARLRLPGHLSRTSGCWPPALDALASPFAARLPSRGSSRLARNQPSVSSRLQARGLPLLASRHPGPRSPPPASPCCPVPGSRNSDLGRLLCSLRTQFGCISRVHHAGAGLFLMCHVCGSRIWGNASALM